MCMGGGGASNNNAAVEQQKAEAAEARQREETRQATINQGVSGVREAFGRYDTSYFDRLRDTFKASQADQLQQQQFSDQEQSGYALARSGLTNSSAGNRQRADLAVGMARQNNDLAQGAEDFVGGQRDKLFGAQQALEAQVRSSADATGAANAATAQAGNIARAPPPTTGAWLAPAISAGVGGYNNYTNATESGFFREQARSLFPNSGRQARTVP